MADSLEIESQPALVSVVSADGQTVEVASPASVTLLPVETSTALEVVAEPPSTLEVFEPDAVVLSVQQASIGLNELSYGFTGLAADDVMVYSGANWTNRPQENLTDGGNF